MAGAYTVVQRRHNGEAILNTTVGQRSIAQAISALERWRKELQHTPEYQADPEARIGLRLDDRIQKLEAASKANEPARIAESQVHKATGCSSGMYLRTKFTPNSITDNYMEAEVIKGGNWFIQDCKTARQLYIGLRDRAMLHLACVTALRGDSLRDILLSDLFCRDVILPELGPDTRLMVRTASFC